jgi:deazaflavin-dependent oxidoreductase (nitroreductase family)
MNRAPESTDPMLELPPAVRAEIAAHHELYLRDPEAAHLWDPAVIGVPGGPVPCLMLFHTGSKSGRRLNTILQYYRMRGQVAIVASKGGVAQHPAWYLNLCAAPACEAWIGSECHHVRARTVAGEERARWWELITAEQPVQREYQARTTREIPVIVLESDETA